MRHDEINPFPACVEIEGISVAGFPNPQSLFERIACETRTTGQTVIHYLNIHVANTAYQQPELKAILKESDLVYCDGAGIVAGSKVLGNPLPTRLTAADWFLDMLDVLGRKKCRVYLLGGEPGVPERAMKVISEQVPTHSVVGVHHGFFRKNQSLTRQVIEDINRSNPDVLIVGLGTPIQEHWIEQYRSELNVPVIYAIGAVMDFVSGRISRCPQWMGNAGFEWLYRLGTEPGRLLGRYVLGNPWFLARITFRVFKRKLFRRLPQRFKQKFKGITSQK